MLSKLAVLESREPQSVGIWNQAFAKMFLPRIFERLVCINYDAEYSKSASSENRWTLARRFNYTNQFWTTRDQH